MPFFHQIAGSERVNGRNMDFKMISLAFGTVSLSNLLYLTTVLTKFWFLLVWVGVQTRCLFLIWKLPYYSLFIEEYLFLRCIQFFKSFLNAQLFDIPY